MMYPKFFLVWLWVIASLSTMAASPFKTYFPFRKFTVNDGLASSTVYYTMQDSKGYLWVLTMSGVNRFDGRHFEHFSIDNGLSDNELFSAHEDSKGRIWFAPYNGKLSYYDNGQFFNSDNHPLLRKAESHSQYTCFLEDTDNGDLWFGTLRNGVIRIRQGQVKHYDIAVATGKINQAFFFFKDKKGRISVQSQRGKLRLDPNEDAFRLYGERHNSGLRNYKKQDNIFFYADSSGAHVEMGQQLYHIPDAVNLNVQNVNCFYLDTEGKLWIGTYNGVLVVDNFRQSPEKQEIKHYLKGVSVGHLRPDREGNLWCATLNDGLYFLDKNFDKIALSDVSTGLPNNNVISIARDGKQLILGFENGIIATIQGDEMSVHSIKSARQTNRVKHIITTEKDIWIAADMGMYRMPKKTFIPERIADETSRKYLLHKNNAIYSATSVGLGQLLANPSGKSFAHYYLMSYPSVTTLCEGAKDTIWFATNKELMFYDDASGQIGLSPLNFRSRIVSMVLLPDRSLLIGTSGRGLFLMKAGRIIKRISTADGLLSNVCNRLYKADDRNIWVCTNKGLCHLQRSDNGSWLISSFTIAEGLPSSEINDVVTDSSGIYVATTKGLCHFKETELRGILPPPILYIASVKAGNRLLQNPHVFELSHNENDLHFQFSGIAFRYGNRLTFQYKLVNNQLEESVEWDNLNSDGLNLASLSSGKYTLLVRCKRHHSNWSNIQRANFVIDSPFWLKWWFILACSMALGLIIWRFYNSRIRYIMKKEKEKRKVQQHINHLEQQALYAMINPHFVFNALSSVQHFINNDEKKQANKYLSKFATLLRKNLENANNSFIPIAEEVVSLDLYLTIEKLRMGEKLSYQITVAPDLDPETTRIPSMILQPYVENAIWHGLAPQEKNGKVSIFFSKLNNNFMQILVQDNGIGIEAARAIRRKQAKSHKSLGMDITRERIEQIADVNGKHGSVVIEEMQDIFNNVIGTVVVIHLPMKPTFAQY